MDVAKAHLKTCDEPIADGKPQVADCGKELDPAYIQWCWDALDVGTTIPLTTMAVCSKCVHAAVGPLGARQRYIYGLGPKKPIARHSEE